MKINSISQSNAINFTAEVEDFAAQGYNKENRAWNVISTKKPGTEFDHDGNAERVNKRFSENEPKLIRKEPKPGKSNIALGDVFVWRTAPLSRGEEQETVVGKFDGYSAKYYSNGGLSHGNESDKIGPYLRFMNVKNEEGTLSLKESNELFTVDEYIEEELKPTKANLASQISKFSENLGKRVNGITELIKKLATSTPDAVAVSLTKDESVNLNILEDIEPVVKKYAELLNIEKQIKMLVRK